MTRQKGKFLTFCFSLVPGAGHMYLGFMKQGVSLMTLFAAMCALAAWLEIGPMLLFAPIIWFYSFFDIINKNSLDPEEFYALEDNYIWGEGWLMINDIPRGKKRKVLSIVLFVTGICMIWRSLRNIIENLAIHWIFYEVFCKLPVFAAAAVIIWLAVRLAQNPQDDMEEFFVDRNEDVPYPIVHPPVMHMNEEKKETADTSVMGNADEAGTQKMADVQNGFTNEDFKKPESKIS